VHELLVTRGVLDAALQAARESGATKIVAIDLVIGELTSVVDDSVQFYFDLLSEQTAAAGARLRFQRVPAVAECGTCGTAHDVAPPLPPVCQACGSAQVRVSGGQQFHVASIEVEP
jgi:hydrogenase nickel incorporation protein HypA/HybF